VTKAWIAGPAVRRARKGRARTSGRGSQGACSCFEILAPFRPGEDELGSLNLERYINGEQPFQDDRLVTPLETIQIEFSDRVVEYGWEPTSGVGERPVALNEPVMLTFVRSGGWSVKNVIDAIVEGYDRIFKARPWPDDDHEYLEHIEVSDVGSVTFLLGS
jgi:hypothetical protein